MDEATTRTKTLGTALALAVVSKNKFRQIVALNFQENHASQDIQRSMHNDGHEILFALLVLKVGIIVSDGLPKQMLG